MPPLHPIGDDYLKTLGDYFDNVVEFETLRNQDEKLTPPDEINLLQPENPTEFISEPIRADEQDLGYAEFAKDSYNSIDDRKDIKDYNYLKEDSTDRIATYKNNDNLVFALKGTSPDSPVGDFIRNTGISLGSIGSAFSYPTHWDNQSHINKVKEKYKDKKIIVTGHSQGGSYANYLGVDNPDYDVKTFNLGTGLPLLKNWMTCKLGNCDNIKNYKIVGDWASSMFGKQGNTFLLRPKIPDSNLREQAEAVERFYLPNDALLSHGVDNFLGRTNKNLKNDYGYYGRKIAGRLGAIAGLAAPLAFDKLGAKAVVASITSPTRSGFDQRGEQFVTLNRLANIKQTIGNVNTFTKGFLGAGVGQIAGEISYDILFKPNESDLQHF